MPATLKKLKRLIKENNIDIVHSHLNPAGVYSHLVCPVPHVHTLHTTYSMDRETQPFKLFLEKYLYFKKKSCNIILLSDFIKEDFLRSVPFKGQAFVLNNFVPDVFFNTSAKVYDQECTSLKLVAVGRLSEVKNFKYLLEVFTYLKDEEIYLDIYGGGDVEKYQEYIKSSGIKVNMKGYNNNMQSLLNEYDVFIMPSKFEGVPLSLFEAMASGIPLMLSAIAPLKNIVKEHAIYFDLDNAATTAAAILSVLKKETDINSMAKKAQVYAHSVARKDIYIQKLLDIYNKLE